jgi:hypothetical protein
VKYIVFILLIFSLAACSHTAATPVPVGSKKILFIGNSFTNYNGGVDKHLNKLAPGLSVSEIAPGGYYLKSHYNNQSTLQAVRTGRWDYVILQEQSQASVTGYSDFTQYARKLDEVIKEAHARTLLFMTWERPDSVQYGVTTDNIANAYISLGKELSAEVAPVGFAFAKALNERPGLVLYNTDGHPTMAGTYLAACVFYAVILKQSPEGNPYSAGLNENDKVFLQHIAAQTALKSQIP